MWYTQIFNDSFKEAKYVMASSRVLKMKGIFQWDCKNPMQTLLLLIVMIGLIFIPFFKLTNSSYGYMESIFLFIDGTCW